MTIRFKEFISFLLLITMVFGLGQLDAKMLGEYWSKQEKNISLEKIQPLQYSRKGSAQKIFFYGRQSKGKSNSPFQINNGQLIVGADWYFHARYFATAKLNYDYLTNNDGQPLDGFGLTAALGYSW